MMKSLMTTLQIVLSTIKSIINSFFIEKLLTSHKKKVTGDIENVYNELKLKYPQRKDNKKLEDYVKHPDLHCFVHQLSNCHFNIGEYVWRLAWAKAIVSLLVILVK